MKGDLFGSRMKAYEVEFKHFLPKKNFFVLRVDMKSGHSYLKYAKRPFDQHVVEAMNRTAEVLCREVQGSICAFTQSDEISVLFTDLGSQNSQTWLGGVIQKIASVSAARASVYFSESYVNSYGQSAVFDSRVFSIADPYEVVNYFLWRQRDAIRNSIQMTAQANFSHKALIGKSCAELLEMLSEQKDVWWNELPAEYRMGRLTKRIEYVSTNELYVRNNGPFEPVVRSKWETVAAHEIVCSEDDSLFKLLPLVCHCGNRVHFGFDGDSTHHRGMCRNCDAVRCDTDPGVCRF